jgi:oxygen-independent coproporphyrinogen-3 oxidase
MRVTHRPEVVKKYLCYLRREIRLAARYLDPRRRVVQIHWGGGTPTFLTPIQIESLGRELHRTFNVAPEAEISLEADPRGLTREHLSAAAQAGFNRISFGVQDFDPVVQEAIGRVQPERLTEQAMTWARAEGFRSINFDLVYGLPHQSVASFRRTIDRVVEMDPERIALFSYAHVPTMKKHQRLIPEQALPSPSEKLRLFKMGIERLTTAGGYRFIGMDHFARPDDELSRAQDEGTLYRNFQGYSTHAGAEVVGFGVSAIGQTARLYTQNLKGLRPYYDRLDAGELATYRGYRLSPEDRMRRAVITDVMCHFRLDKRATEARFGLASFDATFAEALRRLKPLEADGLVRVGEDAIAVTDAGRLLVRNVASAFDAYLRAPKEKAHVYSRSV